MLKVASEAGATVNEYGVMTPLRGPLDAARNYYPKMYQRLIEILRLVTSSGLIMIQTTETAEDEDERVEYRFFLHYAEGSVMAPLLIKGVTISTCRFN